MLAVCATLREEAYVMLNPGMFEVVFEVGLTKGLALGDQYSSLKWSPRICVDQQGEGEDLRSVSATIVMRFRTLDTTDLPRVRFEALEFIDSTKAFPDNADVRVELMNLGKGDMDGTTFTLELEDLRANVSLALDAIYSRTYGMTDPAVRVDGKGLVRTVELRDKLRKFCIFHNDTKNPHWSMRRESFEVVRRRHHFRWAQ
jgi:hypothetical protein